MPPTQCHHSTPPSSAPSLVAALARLVLGFMLLISLALGLVWLDA